MTERAVTHNTDDIIERMAVNKRFSIIIMVFGDLIIAGGYYWLDVSSSRSRDFNFGPAYLMAAGLLILISGIVGTIAYWRQK